MATYPAFPRSAQISWCQVHTPLWLEHAAEIGLDTRQAAAIQAAANESRKKMEAQAAAQQAARAATLEVKTAFRRLALAVGNDIRTIRAHAESTGDPNAVYALAEIPPIARPTPQAPPARPTRVSGRLDATEGSLRLRWKATQPTGAKGTTHIIRRRLPGETEYAFIGVTGKKTFVDRTLPAGVKWVQYIVQGQRGDRAGPASAIFRVQFGSDEDRAKTASVAATAAIVPVHGGMSPGGGGRSYAHGAIAPVHAGT